MMMWLYFFLLQISEMTIHSIDLKEFFNTAFKKENIGYLLLTVFLWLVLTLLLAGEYMPNTKLEAGKVASADVKAFKDFTKLDQNATDKAKLEAARQVPVIMSRDDVLTERVKDDIDLTFKKVRDIRISRQNSEPLSYENSVRKTIPVVLSEKSLQTLIDADPQFVTEIFEPIIKTTIHDVLDNGIYKENLSEAVKNTKILISSQNIPDEFQSVGEDFVSSALRVNMFQDWKAIKDEQAKSMRAVQPVFNHIAKGEIIIRRGEVITPKQIEIFDVMTSYTRSFRLQGMVASGVMVFTLFAILYYYLRIFIPRFLRERRLLAIIGSILTITALTCRITTSISTGFITLTDAAYFAPVASASILIYMLSTARIALLSTVFLSVLASIFSHNNTTGIVSLLTGLVSIISFAHITRRFEMFRASLIVIFANSVIAWIVNMLTPALNDSMWTPFLYGAINGFVSCIIAMGGMVFVENMFPVVTNIKLLDISNPAEPLLQRLINEAPGTHVHSVLTANLAEAGANAIGANALLARVGAYYHDIGKLKRPSLFIENQFGMFNPHDKLTPTLSKLIVISHVKYGVELAKEYNLPEPVIDLIQQHHGTSLVTYFHFQAKKLGGEVSEEDFSYPGPRPQTKEAAIIMMADSIEASVRSLQNRSTTGIGSLIDKIIDRMLANGQFDECEISFKDIKKLKNVFLKSMASLYHTRIDYPDKILKDFSSLELHLLNRRQTKAS